MSIITVCRQAWNSTKAAHQPAFDDLILEYQHMLQQRASGAIASGVANDDGPLAPFDLAAIKSNVDMDPEVKAELVQEVIEEQAAAAPSSKPKPPAPAKRPRKKAAPKVPEKSVKKPPIKVIKKKAVKSMKKGARSVD